MGLDLFASRTSEATLLTEADLQAFADAEIHLWGGLLSGGPGSYCAKLYDVLLLDITGVSPLQAWIPPEIVRGMSTALANCAPEAILEQYQQTYADLEQEYRGPTLAQLTVDITELRKFFQVCADRGLGLIGEY